MSEAASEGKLIDMIFISILSAGTWFSFLCEDVPCVHPPGLPGDGAPGAGPSVQVGLINICWQDE